MFPVIALVGRPNVGKSTLFNRLTRTRDALVASFPGLTRDRQYGKGALGNFDYVVVDTGGLSGDENGIDRPMADQAMQAISEADLVLFIVDSKDGRVTGDEAIAELLRRADVATLLVANKIDGQNQDYVAGEFSSLGFGETAYISATNGNGVSHLVDELIGGHPAMDVDTAADVPPNSGIKIAVVGRPNVGKSTLVNRLLGEDRVVVFDEAGTTRDSIYIPYEREGEAYTLIDTAGVRRRGKVLSHILDAGRALVFAVNKWDGTELEQKNYIKRELERRLVFINFAKTHFISALHGSGVGNIYPSIRKAYESATRSIRTGELNDILEAAIRDHQPPLVRGHRIKLRYAHIGGNNPPIVVIHGNQTESVPDSYKRYLEHSFISGLKLQGTPIRFEFKSSENPFKGRRNKLTKRQVSSKRRLMKHVKKKDKKRR